MFLYEKQTVTYDEAKIVIFPCPLEKTTSYIQGTSLGPKRILEASQEVEFFDSELKKDFSNLEIFTYDSFDYSQLTIDESLEKIEKNVENAIKNSKFSVLIGGEHTISLASIRAAKKVFGSNNFSVLHLDAHSDMRDKYKDNRLNHACVMRRIHEITTSTCSIGIRAQDKSEYDYIRKNTGKFGIFYDTETAKLKELPYKEITKYLPNKKLYITIDLDYFSPAEVPAVGTPVPGGGTYNETIRFMKKIFSEYEVFGFDVVELCPEENKRSDFFGAQLIYKLICYKFSKDPI